jgi:hypothetical protein
MTEQNGDLVIAVQDADILEVIEDADALLARLVADGELLTGGWAGAPTRQAQPRSSRRRRKGSRR